MENRIVVFVIRFNGFVLLVFTENDDDSLAFSQGSFFKKIYQVDVVFLNSGRLRPFISFRESSSCMAVSAWNCRE